MRFEDVTVNVTTGEVSYPMVEGFELDKEKALRTAELFLPYCNGDLEMAIRQAIWGQLSAYRGAKSLMGGLG